MKNEEDKTEQTEAQLGELVNSKALAECSPYSQIRWIELKRVKGGTETSFSSFSWRRGVQKLITAIYNNKNNILISGVLDHLTLKQRHNPEERIGTMSEQEM